jgi:hypothetical protein
MPGIGLGFSYTLKKTLDINHLQYFSLENLTVKICNNVHDTSGAG